MIVAKQAVEKIAEKAEGDAVASPEAREIPLVKPSSVTVNDAGQCWRSVLVRMPQGAVADDLRTPAIWSRVQAVPVAALQKLDRLLCLSFDEKWAAEAIVVFANNNEARLLVQKVYAFAGVQDGLFSDGTLEVFWDGASYGVRRLRDQVPVARGFATEGAAIDELKRQYPKVVGR